VSSEWGSVSLADSRNVVAEHASALVWGSDNRRLSGFRRHSRFASRSDIAPNCDNARTFGRAADQRDQAATESNIPATGCTGIWRDSIAVRDREALLTATVTKASPDSRFSGAGGRDSGPEAESGYTVQKGKTGGTRTGRSGHGNQHLVWRYPWPATEPV
jgi:hypothetical protein